MTSFLDSFSPEVQSQAKNLLGEIRQNNGKSVRIRIEQGQRLLAMKALIGHGGWLAWLVSPDAASGYKNAKTPERDMALAEALGPRLNELTDEMLADLTNLTAMRVLSSDENADALETAIHLMKQGIEVSGKAAERLVTIHAVSPDLGERVRAGKITVDDAYHVAGRIDELCPDPAVVDLVVNTGVKSPGVVEALTVMKREQPERFAEVAASGSLYNAATDQSVPLAEASLADAMLAVNDEDAERAARRRGYIQQWRDEQPDRIAKIAGTLDQVTAELARVVPLGVPVVVFVYPETVKIHA